MIIQARHTNTLFVLFTGLYILCLLVAVWMETWYFAVIPFGLVFVYAGWQHINAVFFLLLAALPFSVELQFTPTLGTDFPDELLMVFVSVLCFFYWLYSPRVLSKRIAGHPLMLLLLITLTWSLITVLFSTDSIVSWKFLLAKCWYIGAFVIAPLIILREKKMIRKAILTLAISILVVVSITMARHFNYGFSFAGINDCIKAILS